MGDHLRRINHLSTSPSHAGQLSRWQVKLGDPSLTHAIPEHLRDESHYKALCKNGYYTITMDDSRALRNPLVDKERTRWGQCFWSVLCVSFIPCLHNTMTTSCTTGLTTMLKEQPLFVQPVIKPGCTTGLTTGCIHDTTGCQNSLTTGLATGCIV